MTANAPQCHPAHFHEKEMPHHVKSQGSPGQESSRCATGNAVHKDAAVSTLPHIGNVVFSGFAGVVSGATHGAGYGAAAGAIIGTLSYYLVYPHLALIAHGAPYAHSLGEGLFRHKPDAVLDPLISPIMKASACSGFFLGSVVGAARGLWNAPYEEIFDTSVHDKAGLVGVCGPGESGY